MAGSDPVMLISVVIAYVISVLLLTYIVLNGDARCHRGTPIAYIHDLITDRIPVFCRSHVLIFLCGNNANRAKIASEGCSVFFEKRVMPAAYLLLLFVGLLTFQTQVVPRLSELEVFTDDSLCPRSRFFCHESTGMAFPPRTYPIAVPIYLVIALGSWLKVMLTDPGTITSINHGKFSDVYPPDNILFSQNAPDCTTCHMKKLPRSKHCGLCDRCVTRFDHHCGWVATCIGIYNIRYFIIFLAVHMVMTLHGSLLCFELIRAKVQMFIAGRYIFVITNKVIDRFSFRVAFIAETTLCAIFMVVTMAGLMVMFFLFYHISLVLRNKTTNEAAKWSTVKNSAMTYQKDYGVTIGDAMTAEKMQSREQQDGDDSGNAEEFLPLFDSKGFPVNIYNNGIIANFAEVFMPHRFVRLRSSRRKIS